MLMTLRKHLPPAMVQTHCRLERWTEAQSELPSLSCAAGHLVAEGYKSLQI